MTWSIHESFSCHRFARGGELKEGTGGDGDLDDGLSTGDRLTLSGEFRRVLLIFLTSNSTRKEQQTVRAQAGRDAHDGDGHEGR